MCINSSSKARVALLYCKGGRRSPSFLQKPMENSSIKQEKIEKIRNSILTQALAITKTVFVKHDNTYLIAGRS